MKDIYSNDVLKYFRELSRIPRESGNEKAVSDWIKEWAEGLGLEVSQDEVWDLIICKAAAEGYEDKDPVILQAHIDMVCEKNRDSSHDFEKDPIDLDFDGEWLKAAGGTTLGADNGIGVAAAMAILADEKLKAPRLEIVFTVQEETTFAGAETVDISGLKGTRMINLDHADEREIIVGSCGGTGVKFTLHLRRAEAIPEGCKPFHIRLTGLKGGHSGEDIHRGHGNAILLLMRILEGPELQVVSIEGGSNRLAIPREAEALVLASDETSLQKLLTEAKATFCKEYGEAAPNLDIICKPVESGETIEDAKLLPLTAESLDKISAAVRLTPNGIVCMNGSFDGLVESSNNIGIISTAGDMLTLTTEVRGAYRSTVDDIVKTIDCLAALLGAEVEYFNGYVPWEFNSESELRKIAISTYKQLYGNEMKPLALHAGLECGFFAEKKEGLDIISIGPDCRYFHSPEEKVRVASVEHFYELLKGILEKL